MYVIFEFVSLLQEFSKFCFAIRVSDGFAAGGCRLKYFLALLLHYFLLYFMFYKTTSHSLYFLRYELA